MIKRIYNFNTQLLNIPTGEPRLLEQKEFNWLNVALNEEIEELKDAMAEQSIVGCVDSLLDLAYFSIGGCVRLGLTAEQIEECFNTIHSANMRKKMGVKETRPTDGSVADAIKPADWVSPETIMETIIFGEG